MKVEKLTEEQVALFPHYVRKWTDIGLSTERANRKEAEDGVREAYRIAGLKEPKIVWCDSPFSQGLTRFIVKKLESDGTLSKKIGDSVRTSVSASVSDSVWDSVSDSVRTSVSASVWDSVSASVSDSVSDSVRTSVSASVWDSVRTSVWDSVRTSVWASVSDSVSDSVRTSVSASVWDSVRTSVSASVWESGYGQHDANWLAFYDFFMEVNDLKKETEKLKGLWKIAKNTGWFLPHENICWISERPLELHRNTKGRLHNTRGMAIKYPDGWGIYSLNGVRFPESLFKKISSENVTAADILSIEDIDQRTQAMRFMPPEDMVKELKGELLDSYQKFDINGEPVGWRLYKFPKGDVFTEDAYYILMDCPSTGKKHLEGVAPSKTVPDAMAWAESNQFVTVTPENWKARVPLLHET